MADSSEDGRQFDVSQEEIDKLIAEVIRYVLFKSHQNLGCPIRREELTHIITKNYRQHALPAYVIKKASEKLSSIFGYEMRELQRARPPSVNQARSSQSNAADPKTYCLISELRADVYKKFVENVNMAHMNGFTFVVVSIVHLAGGNMPEESLWKLLNRMGLSESDKSHPVLGNIKQALEMLIQQRYLQKNRVNGPDGNTVCYQLAERALDEPVNEKIKEYISQIVNKDAVSLDD